ncbi:calcium/proton exchanger [Wallemia mellicola CBS 633.66]|uniref:Calcium/proton exchanger n=1 Tax=Wallemia mellicola (strain ATCC MYA-4683 / CBS 633.66) TaxID=671144 RepID=I4Y5B1_WALMC|nr:calcium/proton exchanger [Wallemia mellicola CBS 633.66]EIM19153.1 calcium/proton exchanger [Wallemia mellicola CBS 633.66]|eukprot:XP_006960815.1 calcium/proton exchanger [Wallemia mellicola CBS 633.66]
MISGFFKRNNSHGSSNNDKQLNSDDDDLKPPSSSSSPFRRPLTFRAFITPAYPVAPVPGYVESIRNTICYSWLNILLISAPISWALHQIHITDIGTFVTSILGVVPLAALLSFGTEEIALRTSVPLGGLLNATLGNLVEIIIAVLALVRCELSIVQSSLLGGLLSNILLVLGMSFIAGGIKFSQQSFKQLPASLNTSLLMLSVMSLMIPLAFHTILGDKFPENPTSEKSFILQMSRGTSIILIFIYLCYMTFTFYTHQEEFLDHVEDDGLISPTHPDSTTQAHVTSLSDDLEAGFKRPQLKRARTAPIIATPLMTSTSTYSGSTKCDETPRIDNKRQVEHPRLNIGTSIAILIITTILLYFTCEALVDSIQGLADSTSASKEWISLIILPIVGNAAEHATAVIAAAKGKQELALAVALGSTVQIAIFVIPLIVLLAWIISKPLTLVFEPMETVVLFLSILLARFAIEDGRSHWLSGCVLLGSYLIIALVFWYFPKSDTFEFITCMT